MSGPVQPAPGPAQVTAGLIDTPAGERLVLVQVGTQNGTTVFAFTPEQCATWAAQLGELAERARTKLDVVRELPRMNGGPKP